MKVLKMTVLAMVVAVSGMNIYNSQVESKNVDHLTLENVEALAGVIVEENDMVQMGCGGNPTWIPNQAIQSAACWNGGTHKKCKDYENVCCDPSLMTDCDPIKL